MKKRDFEGLFKKLELNGPNSGQNSTFRGIKLPRKGGKWSKKCGKVLNLASKRGSDQGWLTPMAF